MKKLTSCTLVAMFKRFEVSGILGFGFPKIRFQVFNASKVSEFKGFYVLRNHGLEVSRSQSFRVSGYLGFENSKFQGFEVPRNQSLRFLRIKISRF
jgi:hypothetical protein